MTLRAKWPACQRSISSAAVARCATDPTNFPPPNGVSDSPADRCHQGGWDQSATVHLSNPQKRTANPFSPTLSDICPASLSARLSSIALDLLAPGLTEPLRISSFPSFSFFFYSSFPHLHINKSAARKGCAVGGFFFFASRTALQLVFCTFMRFCRIFFFLYFCFKMCIFLLQWAACMWKWIQERTGDENFADIVVCHVSFVHLMPMQLLLVILCYFLFEIFMRDKSGGGGCGGGRPLPTTNPRVLVGVSKLTTSNSAAESLILLPVSASGRVFF